MLIYVYRLKNNLVHSLQLALSGVKRMAEASHKKPRTQREPRQHRVSIMLNDSEMRALQRYLDRYDVSNRSRLIREALMRTILQKFDKDSPTLFD